MMRGLVFSFLILFCSASVAQTFSVSGGYTAGTAKASALPDRQGGNGGHLALSFAYKLFYINAGYESFVSKQQNTAAGGTQHIRVSESFFRYQVGVGMNPPRDEQGLYFGVLWGFLSGMDRMKIYHEYPDGTITYGMDKSAGVFRALRSLSSVFSLQAGYGIKQNLVFYAGADFIRRKRRDVFEFKDDNDVRYSHNLSTAGQYRGLNDLHGFRFKLGVMINLTRDND